MNARDKQSGVILLNALATIAIASVLVLVMFKTQETSLVLLQTNTAKAEAKAFIRGAQSSIQVSLLRDLEIAPEEDHYAEVWAASQQDVTDIKNGRISIEIKDAQALFNLSNLNEGSVRELQQLVSILKANSIDPKLAIKIANRIKSNGPYKDINELVHLDIDQETFEAIKKLSIVLPTTKNTKINLNTANKDVFAGVVGRKYEAQRLLRQRERNGFLNSDDFKKVGILKPQTAGWRSNFFLVTTEVEIDGVVVSSKVLFQRHKSKDETFVRIIRHYNV